MFPDIIYYFQGRFVVFVHMEDPSFEARSVMRPNGGGIPSTIDCIVCEIGKNMLTFVCWFTNDFPWKQINWFSTT